MSEGPRSFEEAVARLEALVAAMESGQLTLEESLAHLEEAAALSRHCEGLLSAAESRVKILTGAEGPRPLRTEDGLGPPEAATD